MLKKLLVKKQLISHVNGNNYDPNKEIVFGILSGKNQIHENIPFLKVKHGEIVDEFESQCSEKFTHTQKLHFLYTRSLFSLVKIDFESCLEEKILMYLQSSKGERQGKECYDFVDEVKQVEEYIPYPKERLPCVPMIGDIISCDQFPASGHIVTKHRCIYGGYNITLSTARDIDYIFSMKFSDLDKQYQTESSVEQYSDTRGNVRQFF